jgi:hypothetical protein
MQVPALKEQLASLRRNEEETQRLKKEIASLAGTEVALAKMRARHEDLTAQVGSRSGSQGLSASLP